jgi:curved DNA-binding protein CbpA
MRLDRTLLEWNLYAILDVVPHASPEQIRRAYRRLAAVSHPDLRHDDPVGAQQRMAEINIAAGVLLDPNKRSLYDRLRAELRYRAVVNVPAQRAWDDDVLRDIHLDSRDLEWIERLRSWPAKISTRFEEWREGWSPEFRMLFLVLSLTLAIGLIRFARPTSLPSPFEEASDVPAATARNAHT